MVNLLVPVVGEQSYALYMGLSIAMIVLMAISALTAIILVLLQPSNSSGIDALGGSSETFFGKNKGKSIEAKMKKWTWICLAVLVVFSIAFYVLQLESLWT
ncbi:MAG: preprotein translocase subunit SecG [Clostridia bacterium]|nr:preprotein translocase subunit SecG [Clostridia bacterium]